MFARKHTHPTNQDLAAVLFNVATLLRDQGENPYRVNAYVNGARSLMRRDSASIEDALRATDKTLPHPKGVLGKRLQKRLRELVTTGDLSLLDELCEGLPEHISALMQLPGVGPRTADRLYRALGARTPADVIAAARAGRLQSVWGIGPKRQERLAQLSLFDDAELRRLAA